MSFLDTIRNQHTSVRAAIAWGVAILVVAIILPIWVSSLERSVREPAAQQQERGEGAIGLFLRGSGEEITKQLEKARAQVGSFFEGTPPERRSDDKERNGQRSGVPAAPPGE